MQIAFAKRRELLSDALGHVLGEALRISVDSVSGIEQAGFGLANADVQSKKFAGRMAD